MAFTAILNQEIQAGEPVTQELFGKVQGNFDDHETRITSLEGGSAVFYFPLEFNFTGEQREDSEALLSRLPFNITVQNVRILVVTAGTGGSIECDVEYKRGVGAWTSILTTNPSVAFGAGNYGISNNAVLDLAEVNLQAGDLIRVNTVTAQTGGAYDWSVFIDFTKT